MQERAVATWALQRTNWTQVATTRDPGPREGAQWVEDGIGLLLRGGADVRGVENWRLQNNDWSELPGATPVPHWNPTLVWDPLRNQTVMFGGDEGTGAPPFFGDTWTFDRRWQRHSPTSSPSPRSFAGAAWSAVDGGVLLFGGLAAANDTWLWNGTDWTMATPANAPSPRIAHGMAPDPNGGVLLYSGQTLTGAWLNDHWLWNGATWQQVVQPTMPTVQGGALAAFDPGRGRVVMTGLANPFPSSGNAETWEWDGAQWQQQATAPFGSTIHAYASRICFAPDLGKVRFEGGSTSTFVYLWDGAAWTAGSSSGLTRNEARMVGDTVRNRVLRYPAWHSSSGSFDDIDVVTTTPAFTQHYGNGCSTGTVPGITSHGRPAPGELGFALTTRTFAPSAVAAVAVGFLQQNQTLGGGCSLLVDSVVAVHFTVADAAGDVRSPIPIPQDNGLRGVALLAQAAVLDPAHATFGLLTLSDGLQLRIGD